MSRSDTIEQAKQARRHQQALDEALREQVRRPSDFKLKWTAKNRGYMVAGSSPQDYRDDLKVLLEEIQQEIRTLLAKGANLDTQVEKRDDQGELVGMTSVMNLLLEHAITGDLGAEFAERGARVDQQTLRGLASYAMHRGAAFSSLLHKANPAPRWFDTVLAKAIATPKLNWNELLEDAHLPGGIALGQFKLARQGRPIRIVSAIERMAPGVAQALAKAQEARGEPFGLPALPLDLTPAQATGMLYKILINDTSVEKLEDQDRLTRVQQLLQAGADPMHPCPKSELLPFRPECSMDVACQSLNPEMVELLLSQGATSTHQNTWWALNGVTDRLEGSGVMAFFHNKNEKIKRTGEALLRILVLLDARKELDFQDVCLPQGTGMMGISVKLHGKTLQTIIGQRFPELISEIQIHRQARALDQSTSPAASRGPSRRL